MTIDKKNASANATPTIVVNDEICIVGFSEDEINEALKI